MPDPRPPASRPLETLSRAFQDFAKMEASGGLILMACAVAALVWANSPWGASYFHLWHAKFTLGFGAYRLSEELHFWINDGLMAVFFLLVGLEIKREALIGELASFQKAALPIAAALGGMLFPAAVYALFNRGGPASAGWGIPMATDIAFALGVLALLGDRVPASLKVFLAALAIADDLGAVLVIALFYTAQISWLSLGAAGLLVAVLFALGRVGVRHPLIYVVLGVALWLAVLKSGVHATVAGVLLALTIPAKGAPEECLLIRFEHALAPWIKYLIMPIFALANAGIIVGSEMAGALLAPVNLGIICGLVLGKPLGIGAFSWLAVRSGVAALPSGVGWRHLCGAGILGGIGFTMSLFIAHLAFGESPLLEMAKAGILTASVVAGMAGLLFLRKGRAPA